MNSLIYLFSISKHSKTKNINSLDITFFKPKIDFFKYDYLIITSKQATKALKQYDSSKYLDKKALCISKASADSFKKLGGEVLEIGKGYGDTLLDSIKKYPKSSRWLYLRAEVIASDFADIARADGYSIDDAIVYKSACSKEILSCNVESNATLIFTSPSSVKCFLNKHKILKTHRVIVIGKSSAKALPSSIKYELSPTTTIDSCVELALK